MKKVVRMLGLCALVALAFTSCKKKETNSMAFTATMPTINNEATRTGVGGNGSPYYLQWDEFDCIKLINNEGEQKDFTLKTKNQVSATFNVQGSDAEWLLDLTDPTKPYSAFYPVVDTYTKGDSVINLPIPAIQNVRGGTHNFAKDLYPMHAVNSANNGTRFPFVSEAGFLNLNFGVRQGTSVEIDRIVLTSNNIEDKLYGFMQYNIDGTFLGFIGEGNTITMQYDSPVTVSDVLSAEFNVVLPAGALSSGFTVTVYNGETVIKQESAPAIYTYFDEIQQDSVTLTNVISAQTYTDMSTVQLN